MTSPIPSAPFESSVFNLGDNDEAIEQYLSLLGDYRIHYQDLPLQIPSLAHPRHKQPNTFHDDEDSVGSETTTTLSLHTVPFSLTSMVAASHPPFSTVTHQPDTDRLMDGITNTTNYCTKKMENTPSTLAATPVSSIPSPERLLNPTEPLQSFSCLEVDDVSLQLMCDLGAIHERSVDTPQRTDSASDARRSIGGGHSEQAVASLTKAEDPIEGRDKSIGVTFNHPQPHSSNLHHQKEKVDPRDDTASPLLTATISVSSTSEPTTTPASLPVPKWIRVPPATEHRMKALQQRVRSAERNALDLQSQLTASHVLVDALWDIVMDQQQKFNDSLHPESVSAAYTDIYFIHAACAQLQCWNRLRKWGLPMAAIALIFVVPYYCRDHQWYILSSALILLWFILLPKLQYSHSLE